ncbi:hypothetical protein R1sor_018209 [Riccia sorocarpa]|uniref:Uncharacterized protein n=1 Tax=Riccia sorocarpa TaxID=122646 RepID=A0ABD3I962_9MARC
MAVKTTRLGFEDLIADTKTKNTIPNVWFVTLNLKDAALLLWREMKTDHASLGILLTKISNNPTKPEVLTMKPEGGFTRYDLNPKYCDRQLSKLALGGFSDEREELAVFPLILLQISLCNESHQISTYLQIVAIKRALNAGVFGVLPEAVVYYLPHPEVATKVPAPTAAVVETDDDEDELEEDIC